MVVLLKAELFWDLMLICWASRSQCQAVQEEKQLVFFLDCLTMKMSILPSFRMLGVTCYNMSSHPIRLQSSATLSWLVTKSTSRPIWRNKKRYLYFCSCTVCFEHPVYQTKQHETDSVLFWYAQMPSWSVGLHSWSGNIRYRTIFWWISVCRI